MKEIGDHFGLHYSRVSRIIAQMGKAKRKDLILMCTQRRQTG